MIAAEGFLTLADQRLEYRFVGPLPEAAPTIILLHEGLGCVGLWGDFPEQLTKATGHGVFAFSRSGYGASSPVTLPRPLDYMQREAVLLPHVLEAIGFRKGHLVGHSDGASIAAIYAGSQADHRIRGLTLIAPHFVVEDMTVAAIAEAKTAYETTGLREKLGRWHHDVDNAFYGWNGAWLDPDFRRFDITDCLPFVRVPVQIIQGEDDQYGSRLQIDLAMQECTCPVEVTLMPSVRHAPHREAREETLAAIAAFVQTINRHESQ